MMKAGLTIEELAAEIMRQKEVKEDYVVNTGSLRMEPCGSSLVLRVLDEIQQIVLSRWISANRLIDRSVHI